MSFVFVTLLIFVGLSLITIPIAFTFRRRYRKLNQDSDRGQYQAQRNSEKASLIALVVVILTAILFVWSITAIVGTKKVGVVTEFGKPVGTLSNGLHLKKPWQKVTQLDAAIQTDNHEGARDPEDNSKNPDKCTQARIGNQSTACFDNSIRWRIKKDEADTLYRDYRSFENVRDSLVTRQLTSALNVVFADYDPLDKLDKNKARSKSSLGIRAQRVKERLRKQIGDQIQVLSVIIPIARFNSSTEDKINQFQAALAETRIASQKKKTARNEAAANRTLSNSVSHDPNVLVSKCLDTLNDMVKTKLQIPAGFSCWSGSQSALVVPSAR